MDWDLKSFYLAMNFNFAPGKKGDRVSDGGGARLAVRLKSELERTTGMFCTSRWMLHPHHGKDGYGRIVALTDLMDVARADCLIAIPLTRTARGTHLEIGAAIGLDKPVYLVAPKDRSPTAFDSICLDTPYDWVKAIQKVLNEQQFNIEVQ